MALGPAGGRYFWIRVTRPLVAGPGGTKTHPAITRHGVMRPHRNSPRSKRHGANHLPREGGERINATPRGALPQPTTWTRRENQHHHFSSLLDETASIISDVAL